MSIVTNVNTVPAQHLEDQVLEAVVQCVSQWGWDKVTMDDICVAAGVSRATLYRMFPGGREVLFEAVRVRGLQNFFTVMNAHINGADSLEEILVRCIVIASTELQHDVHLATMLATAPGEALGDLTVNGVARIVRVATSFITPLTQDYITADDAAVLVDLVVRLVISYYLSPSSTLDFTNEDATRHFVQRFVLPALTITTK